MNENDKIDYFYSQLSNKSTGTMEKNLPKSLAVLAFSYGTIGMNSRFLLVVLLFQRYYRVNFGRINWKSIEMSTVCFGNGI